MTATAGSQAVAGVDRERSTARTEAPRDANRRRPWFDAITTVARRKLNALPEWTWYAWKVLRPTDDTLVTGGIPNRRKDGRLREGRARWDGVVGQQCVVTAEEVAEARATYERDSGRCADCAGCGETIKSAGIHGRTYRTCRRCDGSGRAPNPGSASVVLAVDPSWSTPDVAPAVAPETSLF